MLTFIDSGVLISAARGKKPLSDKAFEILDDPRRKFVSSYFIKLEVLPKAIYQNNSSEVAFYNDFFDSVTTWAIINNELLDLALSTAEKYGLSSIDSIHIASAIQTGTDEFITTEKIDKPIHRPKDLKVISIF